VSAHAQKSLGFVSDQDDKTKPSTSRPTKLGRYPFGDVTSAMQKEIRRGDERAAVYWGLILYNEAPQYAWKRVLITAAEDVGFGDPEAVAKVYSLASGWRFMKEGSYFVSAHPFTMAILLLCRAPKSTMVEDLQSLTYEQLKNPQEGDRRPILREHQDGHTAAGKEAGRTWTEWYYDRHVRFGIPVNDYTRELFARRPDWNPEGFVPPDAPDAA
jgi:replication-associated recombination protein RarA